ncbi:MAG: SDR family oxidoreductase [Thermoleophilia bacterium]|nr:SDR family oxidoreductase [Thermoleophilia bacterium]
MGAVRRRQAVKALVTGSNGGLGRAIVERLRTDGYDVVTMDMTEPADLLVDLETDEVPVDDLADIDVCVSNAGIVDILAPAHSMSHAKWDRDIAVNLTGAFRVIQACLRGMRERRYGRIVVMSSFAARCGSPGQVAYCASKAGLLGMAKSIASENVSLGITANSILPGLIGTEKVRALPDELLDRFRAGSGLLGTGRLGEPEEIAGLVAYLASPEAAYVTGQEIVVAGGGDLLQVSLGSSRR